MSKKFFIVVIIILVLFNVGWLGYEKFLAEEPNQEIIVRCIAALFTTIPLYIIFHFSAVFSKDNSYDAQYICYKYGWLVNKFFIQNKPLRLKVFSLLEAFDMENYKKVLKKRKELELLCDCLADKAALNLIEGMCYTAAGMPDKALPHLLSMVTENPLDTNAWALISLNHLRENELTDAKSALSSALRYNTENQLFYFSAALLLFKERNLSATVEYGKKAEELGCVTGILYLVMSICYKTLNMDEQSEEALKKYYNITDYEETIDPRPHLFNHRRKNNKKYLRNVLLSDLIGSRGRR